jgi:uncharacterized protein YpmB
MKLLKSLLIIIIALTFATGFGFGGSSNKLKSSRTEGIGPLQVQIPYLNYTNYYGYVSKDVKPEGKYKNKDAYYLYVWIPAAIDEIGVSMVSPAKGKPKKKKDFVHSKYKSGMKKDKKAFFDTYLVLDRMDVIEASKIKSANKSIQKLTHNDDSSEMGKNPSGRKYNSVMRHKSVLSSPTKALVRGLYRITFTSFRGSVQGSYKSSIGSNIPGIKIAASLEELHKIVNK